MSARSQQLFSKLRWLAATSFVAVTHLRLLRLLVRSRSALHGRCDFAFIYIAGRNWLSGRSPYDLKSLAHARLIQDWAGNAPLWWTSKEILVPFVYPPHWAVIAAPIALLAWPVAAWLWTSVNYVAFWIVCAACWHFSLKRDPTLPRWLLLSALGLCAANGGARWSFGDCQMDLLALAGVVGAVYAHHTRRPYWLAFFAFIAALKPQIGLCPLLFLFVRGGSKGVSFGALGVGIVSALAMVPSGLALFPAQALQSLHVHANQPWEAASQFYNTAALLSIFTARSWPLLLSPLLGLAGAAALARADRHLASELLDDPLWQLGILCALSIAFFPQLGYGFISYTPVLFVALQFKPRWLGAGVAILALLASHTPGLDRGARRIVAPIICLAVLAGCIVALRLATSQRRPHAHRRASGRQPDGTITATDGSR
jgi:hypothetical protein